MFYKLFLRRKRMKKLILILTLSIFATPAFAQCGVASWYTLYGNKTAQGISKVPGPTAAHISLPFGTQIKVTNQRNGKEAIVTINDRGPFSGNRILDVDKTVAEALAFRDRGTTQICLEIL